MAIHRDDSRSFCESMLAYMQSLLARRDHAGIVRYFDTYRSSLDDADGSLAGTILRVVATAYASLTDYSKALQTARVAQSMAARDGDTPVLAEIFITLGHILRDMGEPREAEKAFRDAESVFRRNDHLEGQSRALNLLAGLFFRRNDYRNALATLMDAAEIARRLDDKKKLAFMMGNIGRIHTFTGDFSEAERHLRLNIEISDQLGDVLESAKAHLSLGYVFLQQDDYAQAEAEFDNASAGIAQSKSRRDEVIHLTYLGELMYRRGDLESARRVLNAALAGAEEIGPETTLAGRVMRHLAELCVREDNMRMAQKHAARAMDIMKRGGDDVEVAALWKLRAIIADSASRRNDSRRYFKRAIHMLDEVGVRFEMADALVRAGRAGSFTDRERMTYLFRAEEFYSRRRNAVRADEVARLIESLDTSVESRKRIPSAPTSEQSVDYLTNHPQIVRFKKQLPHLADSDLPLLLTGETGVGKDRMARYYHSLVRPDGPYVAINCASVPENLLESELFGYKKGAFTGADGNKMGLFLKADRGVLLLDEVGDMPLALQAKLLGVLENRCIVPLGGTEEVGLDVKLVAATNRDLEQMVDEGGFRRDLYYRLSGFNFNLPPLRERREDIPLLLQHFMAQHGLIDPDETLPTEFVHRFIEQEWQGNIRELESKVRRMQLMARLVTDGDLVELARAVFGEKSEAEAASLFERVEQFERQLIREAILAAQGNKSRAARILGVHEATVRTKLKRYGIDLDGTAVN